MKLVLSLNTELCTYVHKFYLIFSIFIDLTLQINDSLFSSSTVKRYAVYFIIFLQKYNFYHCIYTNTYTFLFLFVSIFILNICIFICVWKKETDCRQTDSTEDGIQGSLGGGLRIFNLC